MNMRKLQADILFPISSEPIENGILIVEDDGTIVDIIDPSTYELTDKYSGIPLEIFEGVLCPGFVNTHCHLELSYMKGLLPKGTGVAGFLKEVEALKTKKISNKSKQQAMLDAEQEMLENGIIAVGDISNTEASVELKKESKLYFHTFFEVYGSDPEKASRIFQQNKRLLNRFPNDIRLSVTPHATYSISIPLLVKLPPLFRGANSLSIHHLESKDEHSFFRFGTGPIKERLNAFGTNVSYLAPFNKLPLESISDYMPVDKKLQLVHNTFATEADIEFAENTFNQVYWCMCPASNQYIEKVLPDFDLFLNSNCKITIGTDSLATNHSLDILKELQIISENRSISLKKLLKSATLNGAEFLSIEEQFGSFDKGKKPGINLILGLDNNKLCHSTSVKKLF